VEVEADHVDAESAELEDTERARTPRFGSKRRAPRSESRSTKKVRMDTTVASVMRSNNRRQEGVRIEEKDEEMTPVPDESEQHEGIEASASAKASLKARRKSGGQKKGRKNEEKEEEAAEEEDEDIVITQEERMTSGSVGTVHTEDARRSGKRGGKGDGKGEEALYPPGTLGEFSFVLLVG
jgi:hypothetical protein